MEVKTYKYSFTPMLFGMIKAAFCMIILYSLTIGGTSIHGAIYFVCGLIIIMCWLGYLFIKVGLPRLKGKPVLELDDDKLQYFVKELVPLRYYREVICWKDVSEIELNSIPFSRNSSFITFK